jgi:deoxyhypusine synthase
MSRELHDGRQDGLQPLQSLDIRSAEGLGALLDGMSRTAFGGRELGEAYHVLRAMTADPLCTRVVTVAGAMTVGKMGRVLCEMIDAGMVQIIISTGAVMAHGLSEAVGCTHYKHDPAISDKQLYEWGYNRVYDTLEMEANFWRAQELVSETLEGFDWSQPACSWRINRELGRKLVEKGQMPSILGCAFLRDVPVYVPAFTDSELGLDVATYCLAQGYKTGDEADLEKFLSHTPSFNPFLDLCDYTRRVQQAQRLGVFTVGGGVPRNWAQQVGPFSEIINSRVGSKLPVPRFRYGVRLCPEPVHWGGLSGCTYTEGVSWGKFLSVEEGGRFAEVHCDATIAWPLLVKAVLEAS